MATLLNGIYPAFLTPLTAERKFIPQTAEKMLAYLLSTGVNGVYVAGSTGEGLRLPLEERRRLVETIMQVLPSDKKLIVHVGTPDVKDAIALSEHAAAKGAHAISSLPPAGDFTTIRTYYEELAKNSALPLVLYYFPKAAPHAFEDPESLLAICELPNVVAVKFTDFNFYLLQRLVQRGTLVFNGYDEALAAGLLMGAQGGIGSTYNVMPQVYLEIYRAAQRGDWEAARTWQFRANAVIETMLKYPFFPALRAIVKHSGFDCGPLMSGETFKYAGQEAELIEDLEHTMAPEVASLIGWRSAVAR